jgi:thiol-disulfide isomerase/thioredoxin
MKNLYLFVFVLFISCFSKKQPKLVNPAREKKGILSGKKLFISGRILNFNVDSIYFFQRPYTDEILAAAPITSDSFRFEIDSSLLLSQFDIYGLGYKNKELELKSFELYNHVRSTPQQKYYLDAFLIDTGSIYITGDKKRESALFISGGKTNDSYFRTQMISFAYLNNDSIKRCNEIETYISMIKEFPTSEYLLNEIYLNKSTLSKNELSLFLQYFNKTVFKSELGKRMQAYLAKKTDNEPLPDILLEDENGKVSNLLDTTGKVNMIVIWASWCGPCREEIPQLKKLYQLYKYRGLSITNISIDEDITAWKHALNSESMPWRQLIVPKEKTELFNTLYEVGSIPYVIFLDNKGKVITRSIGVDANTQEEYKTIIHKYIPK